MSVMDPPEGVSLWVYHHMDASGKVLYIGSTWQPTARTRQHSHVAVWWPLVASIRWRRVGSRTQERFDIRRHDPPYNVAWTARDTRWQRKA